MKAIFLTAFSILVSAGLFSQVSQVWVQRYNGPVNAGNDQSNAIVIDASGNIYVTGISAGVGVQGDYATIKYNSSGVQQWVARYNGTGNGSDEANDIAVDNAGYVYVTGQSVGSSTNTDIVTIKYNSDGIAVWITRNTVAGNYADAGRSIAVDASGNVYVAGSMAGNGAGNDFTTIKYSSDGNTLWIIKYNRQDVSGDAAKELILDASGNIYVTGYTNIQNTSYGYDCTTIKYNPAGVQQWIIHYNYNGLADNPNAITLDNAGNVIVAGASTGNGPNLGDYVTIKYDQATGTQQWASRYNYQNHNDAVNDVETDPFGNVYVTGYSESTFNGDDYATIKYNAAGVQQWVQRYTTTANDHDEAYAIAVDVAGNVYVTGQAAVSTSDYLTIKYNSGGVQQWMQAYNGTANLGDAAKDILLDNSGNVFVTGQSWGTGAGNDYVTIKYSQMVGIEPVPNEIPDEYSLQQNYPNPFNPVTNIEFSIPKSSSVKISIFDASGKEVETIVNGELKAGTYNVDWNASKFSSGIYFYKLTTDEFFQTKKMVLVK